MTHKRDSCRMTAAFHEPYCLPNSTRNSTDAIATTTTTTMHQELGRTKRVKLWHPRNDDSQSHSRHDVKHVCSTAHEETEIYMDTFEIEWKCSWCQIFKPEKDFYPSSPTGSPDLVMCTHCSFYR